MGVLVSYLPHASRLVLGTASIIFNAFLRFDVNILKNLEKALKMIIFIFNAFLRFDVNIFVSLFFSAFQQSITMSVLKKKH